MNGQGGSGGFRAWMRRAATAPVLSDSTTTRRVTTSSGADAPGQPSPAQNQAEEQADSPASPSTEPPAEQPEGAQGEGGEPPTGGGTPTPAAPTGATTTVDETVVKYGFPRYLLWVAIGFWILASVAGAVSVALPTLPQEATISLDGKSVERCFAIAPDLVAADPAIGNNWCTVDKDLGPNLPDDVEFTRTGSILWQEVGPEQVLAAATQPDVWFTIALGAIAMLFLVGFSRATSTVRAGLAASISVVFFGLLLFPLNFTARIPGDMRSELINAWQLVLIFYFGSEGTVQAIKVLRPGASETGGDLSGGGAATTTTTTTVAAPTTNV